MKLVRTGALAAMLMVGAVTSAPADAATFLFTFSGTSLGNNAQATGSFDIADSALATISTGVTPSYGSVSNLAMTVSGAGAGNGVFSTGNFSTFLFYSPFTLDFGKELVGQKVGSGAAFGQGAGDFNLFSSIAHNPNGYSRFTLAADRGLGSKMTLTSLISTTAVPEPATWAMMILGLGLIGYAARRSRQARQSVPAV